MRMIRLENFLATQGKVDVPRSILKCCNLFTQIEEDELDSGVSPLDELVNEEPIHAAPKGIRRIKSKLMRRLKSTNLR